MLQSSNSLKLPANLMAHVKSKGSHEKFRVGMVYSLSLDVPEEKGNFPAVLKKTGKMIITTDLPALLKISRVLPPCKCRITSRLACICHSLAVAYILLGVEKEDLEKSEPQDLFTLQGIDNLLGKDKKTDTTVTNKPKVIFDWHPGFPGETLSPERFERMIRRQLGKHAA